MRKFVFILALIISVNLHAQHAPLKHVDVPDNYATKINVDKSYNFTNTIDICTASFSLASKKIYHEKGIKYPDLDYNSWCISLRLDSEASTQLNDKAQMQDGLGNLSVGISKITLIIGESKYSINTWYYAGDNKHLMIDINKNITEHISISGFQGLYVNDHLIVKFNDIEQELWRRAAKEVYSLRKDL